MAYLPWIILFTPLLSAALITFFTQKLRDLSAAISVIAVLVSMTATLTLVFTKQTVEPGQFLWLNISQQFQVPIGFTIDQLSKVMLLVVTVIGSLIHIYSLGYMAEDEGKSRYFAGLSLFMFSMLGIVFANNFVMMFIFWELVGVSSYVLIGHWFPRSAPPAAANKAFITNRIGDFGFMLGILMVWVGAGSIMFGDLQRQDVLARLTANPTYLTVATLLVFCGAVGKSAQFPLHVWLPDAMEGPTPVSALIHAATMVAAGVYMLSRIFFLIAASHDAQMVIMSIGIITAVMAALIATQQDDIKRILAYSTLSQLGYMVMAIGLASSAAAMFHLFTHAFFKALLFLGAGSVIHALHHEQNIWKMGGLKNRMPITFITFLLATLALTGCPFFSGFFSKDAILLAARSHQHRVVFSLALATAFLTAFYMFRLLVVVFLGGARSESAKHGHENPPVMTLPLVLLAIPSVIAGYNFFAGKLLTLPTEEHDPAVPVAALAMFILGAAFASLLYFKKTSDPLDFRFLAKKFYIDEFYAWLIRWTQDLLAKISAALDQWVVNGAVRALSGGAYVLGFVLRFLQYGNLQGYAFLFGLGAVALIYYLILSR